MKSRVLPELRVAYDVHGSSTRVVELFAGIGGFRLAADKLGMQTVWVNDLCASAARVYKSQFSGEVATASLTDLVSEVPDHDVLTGGFPCQPYSSAGKKRGGKDVRSDVVESMLAVLAANHPAALVLENVPFLLTVDRGRYFRWLVQRITSLGYDLEWRVVNAADVGVPQYRPRLLLSGTLMPQSASGPRLIHAGEVAPQPVAAVASPDATTLPAWGRQSPGRPMITFSRRPIWRDWSALTMRSALQTAVDDRYDFTESTLRRIADSKPVGRIIRGVEVLYNQAGGSRMGYTVYGTSALAPTLTATASRYYERYLIGERYRRLTPQEYARLQGFPSGHCAEAGLAERYRLVGNAIPPQLASWALARTAVLAGAATESVA
jgi:DNA (cytosine-5)-methyltransferase 1